MFVGYEFLQLQVWDRSEKKKTQRVHHYVARDPEGPGQPTSSPPLEVFSCFFRRESPGILVVLSRRNKKICVHYSFLEIDVKAIII